ncbi:DUF998 domain-containing protein [Actinokineospora auranticolor]|uniref:DUF998 domain-containing protein n=1 Tax=Actinokineospora auranticolor TaxID=155976 RepID=UPI001FEA77F9|nr:DUF998 domain-containing protein [Actinokineospora auranticolor]
MTKSLLGYGVLAGPVYVLVTLGQALTRDGFDPTRHQWSLLANGPGGWVQVVNFVVTGLMVVAFAVGLRRATAARWAPGLVAVYGVSLVGAGLFRADPALGFPAGAPEGLPAEVSGHGLLHLVCGVVGFVAVAVACFAVGRRCAAEGRRGWTVFSRVTGVGLLVGFAMAAAGQGGAAATLAFTAAVLLVWAWCAAVAVDRYRAVGPTA